MVTPPMDLITSQDQELPHVDGHEMAELLAGIESESHLGSNAAPHVEGFPHPHQPIPAPPTSLPHQSLKTGPPQHFDALHDLSQQQQQLLQVKSPILSPTDPFKTVFGDDKEDLKDFPPRVDAQKQLRKWEADEKLGDRATISPVLYANMMHKEELTTKYNGRISIFLPAFKKFVNSTEEFYLFYLFTI